MSPNRDRYRVMEVLGKGGFATVYRAEVIQDGDFRQQRALKFVKAGVEYEEEALRRLRDEARILGLVRHHAVVGVYGLCHFDRGWAVVMELVDGVDTARLVRRGPVPACAALEAAAEVAGALAYAHALRDTDGRPLKLLHRDIKPANIFLTTAGQVKVLDFGAARAEFDARESLTRSMVLGSMRYMAAERLTGVEVPAGDLWSLGITLAEWLCGGPMSPDAIGAPGEGGAGAHIAAHVEATLIAQGAPVDAPTRGELIALLRELLAFDPAHRPTAEAAAQRLRRMSRRVDGPDLRAWGPGAVEQAMAAPRGGRTDELCGAVLRENSAISQLHPVYSPATEAEDGPPALPRGAGPAAAPPAPSRPPPDLSAPAAGPATAPRLPDPAREEPPPPRGRPVLWLGSVGAGAALVLVLAALAWVGAQRPADPPPLTATAPKPAPLPAPVEEPAAAPAAPVASAPPPPATRPAPAPTAPPRPAAPPTPAPARAAPPPAAPEATTAAPTPLRIQTDAPRAWIMSGGARLAEASDPAGAAALRLPDPPDGDLRVWVEINGEERYIGTVSAERGSSFACSSTKRRCGPR